MGFIKIGYNENGEIIHALCKGKPDCPDFFYTDGGGTCKTVKDPIAIDLNQENLKKIINVFKDGRD